MLDMTTAFGVFANGGYKMPLHPILKVTDNKGKVLEEYKPPPSPIFGKKILPEGVIISFDLPKGAYATTFLSHLFTLEGSLASVVNPKKYDLKQVLGTGTMDPALKKLEKFIVARESESEE